jgi:hypothetical protein
MSGVLAGHPLLLLTCAAQLSPLNEEKITSKSVAYRNGSEMRRHRATLSLDTGIGIFRQLIDFT